ncbi:MAG: biopolymer transporter ExbD [Deltaproteobacteria bacterium]|nr:biopolymer transporter ExbD [Deltaproteobacteria bacterium]MBW2419971.1 biopolymer transporter ExbD [Deltaproteobacteria bacterium]
MTTFLNLMVVLVPFLLITAVFSRITIVELSLPSGTGGSSVAAPSFRVEVIVREAGLELTNGTTVIATLPKVEGEYDLETLSELALSLKRDHPNSNDASVLLEPHIEYDHLIQVMDAVRSAALPGAAAADAEAEAAGEEVREMRVALFTDISIGDAP